MVRFQTQLEPTNDPPCTLALHYCTTLSMANTEVSFTSLCESLVTQYDHLNAFKGTFYAFGERLNALASEVKATVIARVQDQCPNLVPTTYEASKTYLDEEILKPEGQRDLTREMCMIWALKVPKGRNILFKAMSTKLLIPLTDGDIISRVAYISN